MTLLKAVKGSAGARYHGVAEDGVPFRGIAGVIGRPLRLVRAFRRDRQPGIERAHSGAVGVAADAARADSRSRPATLFRNLKRALAAYPVSPTPETGDTPWPRRARPRPELATTS